MTHLEALKEGRIATLGYAMSAHTQERVDHWNEAANILDALIKEVEAATADPDTALQQAEQVMRENGRVITFWVSTEWIIEYCSDQHMPPNEEELADIAEWLAQSQDIGTSEAAAMALDEWMQEHWGV